MRKLGPDRHKGSPLHRDALTRIDKVGRAMGRDYARRLVAGHLSGLNGQQLHQSSNRGRNDAPSVARRAQRSPSEKPMPNAAQFTLALFVAPVLERVCGRLLMSLLATHQT